MSDPFDPQAGGLSALPQAASEAGAALDAVRSAGASAADSIDQAFTRAGTNLARTLAKAASDGKLSLGDLAKAAIEAVDSAFGKGSGGSAGGLAGALGALFGAAFGGARADGGPVTAGGAYLVGERGPELFRPAGAGTIDAPPGAGGGVTVNLNLPGGTDAPALLRSEAQVAQALARAVALGRR